jgi:2-dehydro-3-deoxyglucarate aldolase/4-hydroxy-2-oxoheptanedioate aldolase
MRTNHVKQKVQSGGVSIGTFVMEFNTTGIGHLAAQAGAEFAVFDMEHTGWSIETIRQLMATTRGTETVPLVRIPATEYHFVARALDMGAGDYVADGGPEQLAGHFRPVRPPSSGPPAKSAPFGTSQAGYAPRIS